MSTLHHGRGHWLRTLLFVTLAFALVNQSVFGLACLGCVDEVELHAEAPADSSGEDCDSCCDALPPGQCGAQAASMTASQVSWQPDSHSSFAPGVASSPDPPSILAEQFRPPIP